MIWNELVKSSRSRGTSLELGAWLPAAPESWPVHDCPLDPGLKLPNVKEFVRVLQPKEPGSLRREVDTISVTSSVNSAVLHCSPDVDSGHLLNPQSKMEQSQSQVL